MRQIATVLCIFCIIYLFWIDRKRIEGVSKAVWIVFWWMFFAGSHFASQWLSLGQPIDISLQTSSDGSPLDRNVFLFLILSGVWVLKQRSNKWGDIFNQNKWICLFFIYGLISIVWADDSILSFKRWIKGVGNIVIAFVLVTEQRPDEALGVVLRRLGYVLIPLSVLFIKYYPEYGRAYHMGLPMFSGATYGKNALGQICLIIGSYYCWKLLFDKRIEEYDQRLHITVYIIIIPMILWLLYMANSATSLTCMIIAITFLLFARLPLIIRTPNKIFSIGVISVIGFVTLEYSFNIKENIILLLGRRPDLTDRDDIWRIVLSMSENALIGSGYESFWTGSRLTKIWQLLGVTGITQAHNGYIEIYVNQGILGLALLSASLLSSVIKIKNNINSDYSSCVLKITLILITLFYNYTEAMFVPVSNLFVLYLFGIIDIYKTKYYGRNQMNNKSKIKINYMKYKKPI
jgi:exopolysaccharide production protein ExoQ